MATDITTLPAVTGEVLDSSALRAELSKWEKQANGGFSAFERGTAKAAEALYVIQSRALWQIAIDTNGKPFKSFTAYVKTRGWDQSMARVSQLVGNYAKALAEGGGEGSEEAVAFLASRQAGGGGRPVTPKSDASRILRGLDTLVVNANEVIARYAGKQPVENVEVREAMVVLRDALTAIDRSALDIIANPPKDEDDDADDDSDGDDA